MSDVTALSDWSSKTNFDDALYIGYLCDDGTVIGGDLIRQNKKNNKIFVFFNRNGHKYQWMHIPNDRICPPPDSYVIQQTISSNSKATEPTSEDWARYVESALRNIFGMIYFDFFNRSSSYHQHSMNVCQKSEMNFSPKPDLIMHLEKRLITKSKK